MSNLRTRSYSSWHVNQALGSVRLLERIVSEDLKRGELAAARKRLARVEELVNQEILKPRELAPLQLLAARLADAAGETRQTDLYIGRVLAADWLLTGDTKIATDRFCTRLALNRGAVADARNIVDRMERIVTVIPTGHGGLAQEIIDEDTEKVSASTWLLSAEVSLAEGELARAESELSRAKEAAINFAQTLDDAVTFALLAALVRARLGDEAGGAAALARLYQEYATVETASSEINFPEAQTIARIRAACGKIEQATTISPAEAERWSALGASCSGLVEKYLDDPTQILSEDPDELPEADLLLDLLETALSTTEGLSATPVLETLNDVALKSSFDPASSPLTASTAQAPAAREVSLLPLDVSLEHTRLDSITSMFDLDRDTGVLEIDWSSCDQEKIGEAIIADAVNGLAARIHRGLIYFNDGAYVDARFETDEAELIQLAPSEVIYELFRIALCRFPLSRARQLTDDAQAPHQPERIYQRPNSFNLHIAERIDALRSPLLATTDRAETDSARPQLSDQSSNAITSSEFAEFSSSIKDRNDARALQPIFTHELDLLSQLFAATTLDEICAGLHRALSQFELGAAAVSIHLAADSDKQASAAAERLAFFGESNLEMPFQCEQAAGPLLIRLACLETPAISSQPGLTIMLEAAAMRLRTIPAAEQSVFEREGGLSESSVNFIAADPQTHKLLRLVRELAALDGTAPRRKLQHLMIVGERGVGKELVAQALHRWSGRADKPFRAINMSRINTELAPAEIFGARKGGYTGATADRPGLIQQFTGGTLFLDEIDEADDKVQAMLKRVVEYGTYERVGDPAELRTDIRFIVATNRVANETHLIKEDLRDRFWEIRVPPLRERRGDIRPLAAHFARQHEYALPEPVMSWLESSAHDWPGNIRQLQMVVERACSLAGTADELTLDLFHQSITDSNTRQTADQPPEDAMLRDGETLEARLQKIEKAIIERTLDEARGNKTQAAEKLGGTRQWLYKRCQALGIKRT